MADDNAGSLACRRGEMQLSRDLQRRMTECYLTEVRRPSDAPYNHSVGGAWFCPACGVGATEVTRGDLRCPRCSRSLAEFVYALVELHPHRESDGSWR